MSVYLPIVERASQKLVLQSMPDRGDRRITPDELNSDMLRRLVAHWDNLRRGRSMPSRGDLRPENIGFALGHIMLVDIHWPSAATETCDPTFRFRLVGTHIEATGHRGLTGRWAHELQPAFYREAVLRAYVEAAVEGLPSVRRIRYTTGGNQLRYERAALPLSSHGSTADTLLIGSDWELVNRDFFRTWAPLDS